MSEANDTGSRPKPGPAPAGTSSAAPSDRPSGTPSGPPPGPPAAGESGAAGGHRSRLPSTPLTVVAAIVAVVLLAATVLFAILYVHARNDASELASSRASVLTTAQKTAIDFSSYDYRHLDADFAQVASELTPGFRTSYRKTAGALKATLTQYKAVGTAKVLDAGVASLAGGKATVIVFLDQTVTSSTSGTPTVDRNRVRVRLQRSGERWLVSALDLR